MTLVHQGDLKASIRFFVRPERKLMERVDSYEKYVMGKSIAKLVARGVQRHPGVCSASDEAPYGCRR